MTPAEGEGRLNPFTIVDLLLPLRQAGTFMRKLSTNAMLQMHIKAIKLSYFRAPHTEEKNAKFTAKYAMSKQEAKCKQI